MSSALAEVGLSDAAHLATLLKETKNPVVTIYDFEKQNRINLVSLNPALPLLDLHNVTRNEFYQSVFDQMKLVFERRIEDFSKKSKEDRNEALLKILDKAFPLASDPLLQPFVMRMLSKLESIPQDKLEKIMADPVLYQNAPIDVRRHIWLSKPDLFQNEVQELVKQFVDDVEHQVSHFAEFRECPVLKNPREKRANCKILKKIVGMTSGNKDLYDNAVLAIKSTFTTTQLHAQPFVASLRSGLLMALHDSEFKDILRRDEVYKFAWCMDACIRANSIDEKQRRELTTALNGIKKSETIIDAALILFDPSCVNLILLELEKELRQILKVQGFPKGCEKIDFLMRMLRIGTSAPEMAAENSTSEPNLDRSIISRLLTSIINQMALEEERTLDNLIKKISEGPVDDALDENQNYSISTDVWVEQMGIHGRFAGQIFRVLLRACENFQVVLPLLGRHCRDMLSDQIFLFEIAQYLLKTKKNINEDVFQKIFLKFFVSGKQPREIAAKFAGKVIESLGDVITPEFKTLYEEKLKKSKDKEKKEKDKKKKKDKKEETEDSVPRDAKSGKVSKKKGKKGKIDKNSESLKLTLKNLA